MLGDTSQTRRARDSGTRPDRPGTFAGFVHRVTGSACEPFYLIEASEHIQERFEKGGRALEFDTSFGFRGFRRRAPGHSRTRGLRTEEPHHRIPDLVGGHDLHGAGAYGGRRRDGVLVGGGHGHAGRVSRDLHLAGSGVRRGGHEADLHGHRGSGAGLAADGVSEGQPDRSFVDQTSLSDGQGVKIPIGGSGNCGIMMFVESMDQFDGEIVVAVGDETCPGRAAVAVPATPATIAVTDNDPTLTQPARGLAARGRDVRRPASSTDCSAPISRFCSSRGTPFGILTGDWTRALLRSCSRRWVRSRGRKNPRKLPVPRGDCARHALYHHEISDRRRQSPKS